MAIFLSLMIYTGSMLILNYLYIKELAKNSNPSELETTNSKLLYQAKSYQKEIEKLELKYKKALEDSEQLKIELENLKIILDEIINYY